MSGGGVAHEEEGRAQARIEAGNYDKAVGSVPAHAQCAQDVELVFNNAAVCDNSGI